MSWQDNSREIAFQKTVPLGIGKLSSEKLPSRYIASLPFLPQKIMPFLSIQTHTHTHNHTQTNIHIHKHTSFTHKQTYTYTSTPVNQHMDIKMLSGNYILLKRPRDLVMRFFMSFVYAFYLESCQYSRCLDLVIKQKAVVFK